MKLVFCIDSDNIPDCYFKEKPVDGQLYIVQKEYESSYVLIGVYNESEFIGGKWRSPSFHKNRFVEFNNCYNITEFNELNTITDVEIYFALNDIKQPDTEDGFFID